MVNSVSASSSFFISIILYLTKVKIKHIASKQDIEKQLANSEGSIQRLIGGIFTVLGLVIFVILVIVYNSVGLPGGDDVPELNRYLPYFIPGLVGVIFFIVGLIMFFIGRRKRRKIHTLIKDGRVYDVVVASNIQNFYYKVNGVPQRVVQFKGSSGQVWEYTFFSEQWASNFPVNSQWKIRVDKDGNCIPDPAFIASITQ